MPYTEHGIFHIASIGTYPHAVFILYFQEYLVGRLCSWMQWRDSITQALADNLKGKIMFYQFVAKIICQASGSLNLCCISTCGIYLLQTRINL